MRRQKKHRKLGAVGRWMLFANLVIAALLLASYISPVVDPLRFWPAALFGLAYIPVLAINLLFVFFWLLRRSWLVLISVIAILTGWEPLNAHIGFRFPAEKAPLSSDAFSRQPSADADPGAADSSSDRTASPGNLRVMTYNVHLFRGFDQTENEPDIKEEVLSLIGEVSPDVVCIQEYYTRAKGEHDISSVFKTRLGLLHQFFLPVAKNNFEAYGMAIFSKYPIVSTGRLSDFQKGVNGIIFADIEKDGQIFRIYNVHLRSFGFQKEDYDFIKGGSAPNETNVSSTRRIGSRLKQGFINRSLQAQALRKHIERNEIPYILLGDFNDTPLSFSVNHVGRGLQNTFREKGRGWARTYNGDFPNFQIDYIFASNDFSVIRHEIIRRKLSDHYPVWADVSLLN